MCCCLIAESTGAVALATLAEAYQVMASDHSFSAESRSNLHNFHSTLTLHYPGSQIFCWGLAKLHSESLSRLSSRLARSPLCPVFSSSSVTVSRCSSTDPVHLAHTDGT